MNTARARSFRRIAFTVSVATATQSFAPALIPCAQAQAMTPDAQATGQPVAPDSATIPMPLPVPVEAASSPPPPLQVPRPPPGVPLRTNAMPPATAMPMPAAPMPAAPVSVPAAMPPSAQPVQPQPGQPVAMQQGQRATLPELQALVAPIALYPDSLLAQMLIASTYPLDVAAATIWLQDRNNAKLSGTALETALQEQRWDNSVKSLVQFPDALRMLGNKLEWAQKLGDAYLAQPAELMQAVQALRTQAKNAGHLQSGSQMTVSTDPQSNIVIAPTNPQVLYVPTYNPYVVYGPWLYPAYPPWPVYNPGWGLVAFGVGFGVGAALWATPYWGRGYVYVNHGYYNRFNNAYNAAWHRGPVRPGPGGPWVYNPAHRGNVPYTNPGLNARYANPQQRQQFAQARAAAQNYWNKNPGARTSPIGAAAGASAVPRAHGTAPAGGGGRSGGGRSGHR